MLGLMSFGAPSCLPIGGRTLAGLVPRAALMLGDAYGDCMLWEVSPSGGRGLKYVAVANSTPQSHPSHMHHNASHPTTTGRGATPVSPHPLPSRTTFAPASTNIKAGHSAGLSVDRRRCLLSHTDCKKYMLGWSNVVIFHA